MAQSYDTETWQEKRAFEETNLRMLNDNVLSDVTFIMGTNKEAVKAHKFMLASRSPVFYAMFCGSMSETSSTIEILDIEPEIMSILLGFMYTEDYTLDGESVMALLYAAKKYTIKRLEQKCRTFLSEQISCENVCAIFAQAHSFSEMELKQKCFTFILSNGKQVLQTEGFRTLHKELLTEILESDDMEASEVDIYESCKTWATYQLCKGDESQDSSHSEMRNILGDLLYLIRFPVMSIEHFTTKCSQDDILSSDEKVSMFQCIAIGLKGDKFKFSDKERACSSKTIITRLNSRVTCWNYGGSTDAIDFIVSKQAKFFGIGLYSPSVIGTIKGNVSLLGTDQTVIVDKWVEITYSISKYHEEVLFDEGVTLLPYNKYTIKVVLKGPSTFYGNKGHKEVTESGLHITFSDNDISTNGTCTSQGQIPFLILGIKSD